LEVSEIGKEKNFVCLCAHILAVPTLYLMLSLKQQPHATLGTEFTGADGRVIIILEPELWIGKEFPLISRFAEAEGAEILLQGTWNVVLVQPGCSDCVTKMAELEREQPENVAVMAIPSRSERTLFQTSFPTFVLDTQNEWFVETPRVVRQAEGICVAVGE
jgi:hypothetical protein